MNTMWRPFYGGVAQYNTIPTRGHLKEVTTKGLTVETQFQHCRIRLKESSLSVVGRLLYISKGPSCV